MSTKYCFVGIARIARRSGYNPRRWALVLEGGHIPSKDFILTGFFMSTKYCFVGIARIARRSGYNPRRRALVLEGGHIPSKDFIFTGFFFILVDILFIMWYYVYILELSNSKHYVGCTVNLKERFNRHSSGRVKSTKPHLPVKLLWCCSFPNRYMAYKFERYMKSGSGRAFASRHLYEMCH